MIISQTPFRISFFGGGTDYPEFYREHGGATLLTTINKYCYISLHSIRPYFSYRYRASYLKSETVNSPADFSHPLIRESLLYVRPSVGLEIAHVSELPSRTGMGTSSSFTVGLLNALHAMRHDRTSPEDLARESIIIERERVGDSGGHQDQYAAAYGGLMCLRFNKNNRVDVKRLSLRSSRIHELENHLLLLYTGVEQSAESIVRDQKNRTRKNSKALLEMLAIVREAERILENESNLSEFGRLLHETWVLKKTLARRISNPEIDNLYSAARGAGALGGKLLGAGGRGFLLIFAPPGRHPRIMKKLRGLKPVPFNFSMEGSRIIFQSPE